MTTHHYIINAKRISTINQVEDFDFQLFNPHYTNIPTLNYHTLTYNVTSSCRETITSRIFDLLSNNFKEGQIMPLQITIKTLGHQFNKVSQILALEDYQKRVSEFIAKIFKLKIDIFAGQDVPTNKSITILKDGVNPLLNYLKVRVIVTRKGLMGKFKLGNSQFISIKVSAILALLREPDIIYDIINGVIKDWKTLVQKLLVISRARLLGEDKSYGDNFDKIFHLSLEMNSTGTDWASITFLSLYITGLSLGIITSSRVINRLFNGPVQYFCNSLTVNKKNNVLKFLRDNGEGLFFLMHINNINIQTMIRNLYRV